MVNIDLGSFDIELKDVEDFKLHYETNVRYNAALEKYVDKYYLEQLQQICEVISEQFIDGLINKENGVVDSIIDDINAAGMEDD